MQDNASGRARNAVIILYDGMERIFVYQFSKVVESVLCSVHFGSLAVAQQFTSQRASSGQEQTLLV